MSAYVFIVVNTFNALEEDLIVINETNNIDDDINNFVEHRQSFSMIKSSSLIVFKNFFERIYQQRKNTNSNRSSDVNNI
jgi:hypothetical protein